MRAKPFSSAAKAAWRRLAEWFSPGVVDSQPLTVPHFPPAAGMPEAWMRFPHVPTMLTTEELQLLFWLTGEVYSGRGSVVDLGPFLGGSTAALCAGLADNPRPLSKDGVIHSYDRFVYETYFESWTAGLGEKIQPGDSFLPLYRRLLGDFLRHVVVHPGDLLGASYDAGPIEVLFVDICKSWELNSAVVRLFFPHLMPGTSVVVQQDYLHFYEFWLVITMDYFADYFEPVGRVAQGTSSVYRYKRHIPERMLQTDLRALPLKRKRLAFEREAARSSGWQRNEILFGYIRMLVQEGDVSGAREVFRRIDPVWYDHPVSQVALSFIPYPIRAAACERIQLVRPRPGRHRPSRPAWK